MRQPHARLRKKRLSDENPYWISFSDLTSALLLIFILVVIALLIELSQVRTQLATEIHSLQKAGNVRREMLHEIRDRLREQNIHVTIAENDAVLRIPEEALSFEVNEYALSEETAAFDKLYIIGQILYDALTAYTPDGESRMEYLDTIFIEGHTDSRPTTREQGNWGLSAFRAIEIWKFWNSTLQTERKFQELTNSEEQKLFSISGYAASRRVVEEASTEAEHRQNRRIDIRITLRKPKAYDLQQMLEIVNTSAPSEL
jgi:flagellar motor protein MotB